MFPESDNTHDKKVVAVYKDGSVVGVCTRSGMHVQDSVGCHVPQELFCSLPNYPALDVITHMIMHMHNTYTHINFYVHTAT